MSRFVIAGATGRVGSVVARLLLDQGKAVTIITRSAERGAAFSTQGADVAVGSLADLRFLTRVLDGATAFFAVLPEPMDAVDFHAERRQMADIVATAIARSSPSHVVVLSSVGADIADHMGPISDLHYFEHAILGTGKPVAILRSSMFQDNIAMAIEPARTAGIFPNLQPDRDARIPMVAISDVAAVAVNALTQVPSAATLVTDILGPSYSPRQAAAALGSVLGRAVDISDIPASEHVAALTRNGLPEPLARAIAELQQAIAGGRMVPVGDRLEIGTTTLEQTLRGILDASTPAMTV